MERQFIPNATDSTNGPCIKCHISRLPTSRGQLCDLCWAMLEAVSSHYWLSLQREWDHENDILRANKARLLRVDGGDCDATC